MVQCTTQRNFNQVPYNNSKVQIKDSQSSVAFLNCDQNSMILNFRAQAVDNLSGSEDFEGRLPNNSSSTSSAEPMAEPQQIRRSRSHTPNVKKKHKSHSTSDPNSISQPMSYNGTSPPKRQTQTLPDSRLQPSYYLQPPKFPNSQPPQSYQNADDFSAQNTNRYLPYHESQLDRSKLI